MTIELEHTVLAGAGSGIAASADQVGNALERLRTTLDSLGTPWGEDELGGPFGSQYTALVARALTAIGSYHDQLTFAADALGATAEELQEGQELSAEALRQVWQPPVSQ